MIVLDASAVLELLLHTRAGGGVADRITADESLHAPHLLTIEVTQVIRRYRATGSVTGEIAAAALVDLVDLDIARYPHEPFVGRVWELRDNLTAYDAVYVALAELLGAPLLTFDRRLARSPGHEARIELLPA